jgi:hypothetical protein
LFLNTHTTQLTQSNSNSSITTHQPAKIVKMSAIADADPSKPIQVLFAVHDGFDTLDVLGPLEIFAHAAHDGAKEPGKYHFCLTTSLDEHH